MSALTGLFPSSKSEYMAALSCGRVRSDPGTASKVTFVGCCIPHTDLYVVTFLRYLKDETLAMSE